VPAITSAHFRACSNALLDNRKRTTGLDGVSRHARSHDGDGERIAQRVKDVPVLDQQQPGCEFFLGNACCSRTWVKTRELSAALRGLSGNDLRLRDGRTRCRAVGQTTSHHDVLTKDKFAAGHAARAAALVPAAPGDPRGKDGRGLR
jgi:hypothetical protein